MPPVTITSCRVRINLKFAKKRRAMMFSDQFRERLRLGKYSRWAVNLTEAELEAVLWMVGEFGYRAFHVLPLLATHWGHEAAGRAALGLESLFRVVGGDRPDLDALELRVRTLLAEVRGNAGDTGGPPAHSWPVLWQGLPVGWITSPVLDEYGNCSGVWYPDPVGSGEFLDQVGRPPPDGIRVSVGGIPAWVRLPLDDTGRMAFWLHVSPHAYELLVRSNAELGAAAEPTAGPPAADEENP
jgi:hypothetical protein